jgi:hypothetical protein
MSFLLAFLGKNWLAVGLGAACAWLFIANANLKGDLADERTAFADYRTTQALALTQAVTAAVRAAEAAKDLERTAAVEEAEAQREVQIVTETIIKEVEVYVTPATNLSYPVPNGFVYAHDAAASGSPTIAAIANRTGQPASAASAITMSRSAELLAANYGACRANAVQLTSLIKWENDVQAWWKEVEVAWPSQ